MDLIMSTIILVQCGAPDTQISQLIFTDQ